MQERKRTRADIALQRREQGAGQRHRRSRNDESHGADADQVDTDRTRRDLGIAGGAHRVTPAAALQPIEQDDADKHQNRAGDCKTALRQRVAEDRHRRAQNEAVPATGEALPFDGDVLDDEPERDRDHREIWTPDAQRGHRKQATNDADQNDAGSGGREIGPAGLLHQQNGRVGADCHEADVSKRDLARQSEQDVEADAGDRGQRNGGDQEYRIAVGNCGVAENHRERDKSCEEGCAGSHTFFTPARPSSPWGITTRMTMTEAKVMICV